MPPALTAKQLEEKLTGRVNLLVKFHPSFRLRYQEDNPDKQILTKNWRDGITRTVLIESIIPFNGAYFVKYKCLNLDCLQCSISYPAGHFLVIKKDGSCVEKRIEYLEYKKRTDIKEEKQYAFMDPQ